MSHYDNTQIAKKATMTAIDKLIKLITSSQGYTISDFQSAIEAIEDRLNDIVTQCIRESTALCNAHHAHHERLALQAKLEDQDSQHSQ